tara:strand:+ start:4489 stop:5145 length:657 start_codon:yes stop_codon:yes gene_type:complete
MNINFISDDPTIINMFPPQPIINDYPKWLDTTDTTKSDYTVKHCMPVMDYINSGYIIYNAWEYSLEEKMLGFTKGLEIESMNPRPERRRISPSVFAGTALPAKSRASKAYFKIETDYKIVTPPGYSCLVMQPFYDFTEDYTIMPAVIDTDKYDYVISAVGYVNKPKIVIPPGARILQVIPFKREEWNMSIKEDNLRSKLFHYIHGAYESVFHSKKRYK